MAVLAQYLYYRYMKFNGRREQRGPSGQRVDRRVSRAAQRVRNRKGETPVIFGMQVL
jgi:hypothetical protein